MSAIKNELLALAHPRKAELLARYFKTGKGEYGEGDVFLGLTVPQVRKISKKYYLELGLHELAELLHDTYHEVRLAGCLILVEKFKRGNREELFDFYLNNLKGINNWDLVDQTAPTIMGEYLQNKDKTILTTLAQSPTLWERRIAIIATLAFIRKGKIDETIRISKLLLTDTHDLIHKAVGWMLREAWKKDAKKVEQFLTKHFTSLPRTTLRYAIEKMPENERKQWLSKNQR